MHLCLSTLEIGIQGIRKFILCCDAQAKRTALHCRRIRGRPPMLELNEQTNNTNNAIRLTIGGSN